MEITLNGNDIIQMGMFGGIVLVLWLTTFIKMQHYKKMCEIRERHIKVLEEGMAPLVESNKAMRELLTETASVLTDLRSKMFPSTDVED